MSSLTCLLHRSEALLLVIRPEVPAARAVMQGLACGEGVQSQVGHTPPTGQTLGNAGSHLLLSSPLHLLTTVSACARTNTGSAVTQATLTTPATVRFLIRPMAATGEACF